MVNSEPSVLVVPEGEEQIEIVAKKKQWGIIRLFSYLGPGFLICIAYVDPGNFETDFQAGAEYKYSLLWVAFWATCAALLIQSLATNLGIVTGKHLSEHCKAEYAPKLNYCLWIAAEVSVIASDMPEVLGTALALNLLFNIKVWIGVLLTGVITIAFLALHYFGARKLEIPVAILVIAMASCFFVELGYAKPKFEEVIKGIVIPRLNGEGAIGLAISFVGSIIMPYNLYLHSALVLNKKDLQRVDGLKEARKFFIIETTIALFMSFIINASVVSISGAICSNPLLSPSDQDKCDNLDLNQATFLLGNVLGSWSSTLFGVTVIASGQMSTITGTYAGQYVMEGFLNIKIVPWLRNLITRGVAIIPSLIAAIIGGARGAGSLIIISSLPFALIPLLKFTSDEAKMGVYKNHILVTITTWALGTLVIGINMYYLGSSLYDWLSSHAAMGKAQIILIGITGFGAMFGYLIVILYLTFRRDKKGCINDNEHHNVVLIE